MSVPTNNPSMEFEKLDELVQLSPFHQWLGVRLQALSKDGVELLMPWRSEFVSVAGIGYTHGGILAALIDIAGDYAIAAHLGHGVPTVDMRVDYHRPAMPGPLLAKAAAIKLGRTLCTAEARIHDEAGLLVASGRGVYLNRR
ncbi:MAG: PaaI family thioesterase [Rhodospirillales bacterium]|nr:PaaI family thioesterase [Rhodospirillales bacterium]